MQRAQERAHRANRRIHGDAGAAWGVGMGVSNRLYRHRSYDAFADEDVNQRFDVWLSHDLLSLSANLIAAGELGFGSESAHNTELLDGALSTKLRSYHLHAGVNLRWVLAPMFQPHLRAVFAPAIIRAELELEQDGTHLQESHFSPAADLGVGFTLRTPTRLFETRGGRLASLSLGLLLEVGFSFAKALPLALQSDGEEGMIARESADLGRLIRSGPYLRSTLVARF